MIKVSIHSNRDATHIIQNPATLTLPFVAFALFEFNVYQIWSMKKEEDAAKKKKPKTSPAQLRVQKGESMHRISHLRSAFFHFRPIGGASEEQKMY